MKRKLLPLTLMLIAGLATVIITFIRGDSIIYKLVSLLVVFLIFYVIGSVIVMFLDHFDKVNKAAEEAAETVLEKDADGEILGSKDTDQARSDGQDN
ncbi:MAG: hypothetical protein K5871_00700 [Lachnospiraceae bacterium]|nr:hypothetical protein [Lachnospiraceae bacterium]